jgi:hypothetical protein
VTDKPTSIASAFAARGHENTIYWQAHGVKGHGTMRPEVHGSLARYLMGESVGSLQGEHANLDVLTAFARHPQGLNLGDAYVVTKEDLSDVEYIDVDGVPAYTWIEPRALRLGIDPRGNQGPKPEEPDNKARMALQAILDSADDGPTPPARGGGAAWHEVRRLRSLIQKEAAKGLALLLLVVLLPALGCRSLRALIPGGVAASDAEWTAVVTAPAIDILAIVAENDPRAKAALAVAQLLGVQTPVGVALLLTPAGETIPRLVRCEGDFEQRCRALKINATVHFAGHQDGPLWVPSAIRLVQ